MQINDAGFIYSGAGSKKWKFWQVSFCRCVIYPDDPWYTEPALKNFTYLSNAICIKNI
ncbi:MAG TPA: hypothetical protein PKZ37_04995 [Gallionellaceae bacterium]|nr:hypothetical protein [Gallionellaceae bacterium]